MRGRAVEGAAIVIVLAAISGGGGCGRRAERPCDCPDVPASAAPAVGGVRHAAPAAADAGPAGSPTEADARAFIETEYLPWVERLERVTALAGWNAYALGTKDLYQAREDAEILYRRFHSDRAAFERVKAMRESPEIRDPRLRREVEVIYLEYLDNQIDPDLNARIVELSTALEERFNTFRADFRGARRTDNELKEILRNTQDSAEAREAWEALKQVGPLVSDDLVNLVEMRNEAARQVGFPDYYTMRLALAEQTPEQIKEIFDRVVALTDEPFRKAKAELDAEMAARFNLQVSDLRPWHYGDPFFQQAPPVGGLDRNALWKGRDILAIAKGFYSGIGIDVAPILERSDLYEREGKVQHAFCFDIDRSGDVRILLNLKDDARWAETTLHEFGHGVYDLGIDPNLPWPLRGAAHTLTTEGIAMMFGGLTNNPKFLEAVLALPPAQVAAITDQIRRQQVLEWMIFARWAMVMTDFERELYANPRQDLAALWWSTVERLQLIVRPEDRTAPDWATKIHIVSAPVYYHNYLLGELFSAQLRRAIGKALFGTENPNDVIFVGHPEVGPWLREKVFGPGRTLRWDDFVSQVTGAPLGPEAFVGQME